MNRVELDYVYFMGDLPAIDQKAYYVVDAFDGPLYQRLVENGCAVFGCGAIITSLSLKIGLPKRKNNRQGGMASLAMVGLTVCFTNIRKVNYQFIFPSLIGIVRKIAIL